MTSVSKTIYASGASIEVYKKPLNSGDYIQLKISYETMDAMYGTDVFVATLTPEAAKEMAEAILKI